MNRACLWLIAALSVVACSKTNEVNVNGGASGEAGSAGSGPGLPDCTSAAMPAIKEGSGDMAAFGLLGGGCFWIDKTEVTWGAYRKFLEAVKASPPIPDERCAWNKGLLEPDAECFVTAQGDGIVSSQDDQYPVTCVDFCDAESFCSWAGKRLCNNDKDAWKDGNDAAHDAWFSACSGGNAHAYPYDQEFAQGICNDPSRPAASCPSGVPCSTMPAAGAQGCNDAEGRGVHDMSGNASEWTGACNANLGQADLCRVAGGSFLSADPRCSFLEELRRDAHRPTVGFRCCADPAK